MDSMEIFSVIANACSILSLIIGIISLIFVNSIKKKISITQNGEKSKSSVNDSGQSIQADNITNSSVNQTIGNRK